MSFSNDVALKKEEALSLQDRSYFRISSLGFLPQDMMEQVPMSCVKSTDNKYRKAFISIHP